MTGSKTNFSQLDIDDHDGSTVGLSLAGVLVTATAAELNTVDVTTAGTAQASKALVLDSNKESTGLGKMTFAPSKTDADAGNYGATLNTSWIELDPGSGGSFGAKLMFSNADTSGYTLYGLGIRCRANAAQANAVGLNVSASAAAANSGQIMAGEFYLQNSGSFTINDTGGLPSTALHVKSWLAAACSQVASALWVDDESSTKATTQYMVNITMNGSVEIDKVFHIYGGDPGADTFIDFDTCDQGAGAFVAATASGGATRSHRIKCTVNGSTVGYMSLYTD
ncbi:MAG TPA: hypothetical protein VIY48_16005 [Candidatus Paceibacterota bacterium]